MVNALPRLVIAAPASGQGKTTIATGLMAALTRKQITVAPAKIGPDYIDPGYHALATGRPGRNLDPWLVGEQRILPLLLHGAGVGSDDPAQMAVIEGVMGLYDGMLSTKGFSSTAHVARLTDSPILLVVDVTGAARTVAATVLGMMHFDENLRIGGVILNRVGSARHAHELTTTVESVGVDVIGCVPRDARMGAPSRHLGLVPTAERADAEETIARLAKQVGGNVDLDAVVDIALHAPPIDAEPWSPAAEVDALPEQTERPVIAIAGGPAFTFRYTETNELLRAAGCEPVVFDPAKDEELPAGTRGLYLGGGFPEVHAGALTGNRKLLQQIRSEIAAGLPTYAECAGLLYLADRLDDRPMTGVVPATAAMSPRLTLRYATGTAEHASAFAEPGDQVRGHEFHRTTTTPSSSEQAAWHLQSQMGEVDEGFLLDPTGLGKPSVLASYLHLHFAGSPWLATRFAAAAAAYTPSPSTPRQADLEPEEPTTAPGEVILVGAGPGDAGLLTIAGKQALDQAEVIVTDRLVPMELLDHAASHAQIIHVGKIPRGAYTPQEQINALLVEHARAGRRVVRFKGGDNFVFGRGGEEWLACAAAGIPVKVIPGVTSSVAGAALAGIPVTHRSVTQGFTVVSAHVGPDDPRCQVNWQALATSELTLVVMMGVATLPKVAETLIRHGLDADTPAATIAEAGLPTMRVVRGRLDQIAERTEAAHIAPPAVTVIGHVVNALHDDELNQLQQPESVEAR